MAMRKATILKQIEKLGYGRHIIDNCDTEDPKIIKLGCELIDGDDDKIPGDYYGTNREPWPTIAPELEALADKAGSYWEWENPAIITMYL